MAEITEVFEDFSDNVKKTVKKKPLVAAGIGVGIVALLVWWSKQKRGSEAVAYEAIGYGGYPEVSGGGSGGFTGDMSGGSDNSALYEQIIYENSAYYEKLLNDIDTTHTAEIEDLNTRLNTLTTTAQTSEEKAAAYETALQREQVISQMRANSELYNTITDRATKDALHAENMALAEMMGWEFNPETGNYFEGNSVVYTTAKQQAGYDTKYTGGAPVTTGTFVNNQTYNESIVKSVLGSSSPDKVTVNTTKSSGGTKIVAKNTETGESKIYKVASDGKPIEYNSGVTSKKTVENPDGTTKTVTVKPSTKQPSMARDKSRAGTTITTGDWAITYDNDGYAVRKTRVN